MPLGVALANEHVRLPQQRCPLLTLGDPGGRRCRGGAIASV